MSGVSGGPERALIDNNVLRMCRKNVPGGAAERKMLEQTFVHVNGIGSHTERRIWRAGCDSWWAFLAQPTAYPVPKARLAATLDVVSRSPGALSRGDWRFFRERLAARDHWRALPNFADRIRYLDIETDGGTEYENITVIGVSDGVTLRQFVRGENLMDFPEAMEEVAVLVSFFGSGFDLPVLRNAFPRLPLDQLHLDLCPLLRRLGLTGGLKRVEQVLGIPRSPETAGLSGWDAVRLWREWHWGSADARRVLLAYNGEDVENMIPLARFAFAQMTVAALAPDSKERPVGAPTPDECRHPGVPLGL